MATSNVICAASQITTTCRGMRDLYQQPGIAETVNFYHIKRHCYMTHDDISRSQIVPAGPIQDLLVPHGPRVYWFFTKDLTDA